MTNHRLTSRRFCLLAGALLWLVSIAGCSRSSPAQDEAAALTATESAVTPAAPSPTPIDADIVLPGTTEHELVITYIGDTGFIIQSGDTKIAVNVFFDFEYCVGPPSPHESLPIEHQSLMAAGQPPFDDIDIIIATSPHDNNYDRHLVADYLHSHPDTVFISGEEAAILVSWVYDFEEGRIMDLSLEGPQSETVTVHGVDIEFMNMPVLGYENTEEYYANMGVLISLGGYTVFHPGNLTGDDDLAAQMLQDYQIPDRDIDVAFMPFFLMLPDGVVVQENIDADLIIPDYFWCVRPDPLERWDAEYAEETFPNMILLDEVLQTLMLEPVPSGP
jgi:L-ascorbate metabolism protein UlaG (beta-lactamase superfamily)